MDGVEQGVAELPGLTRPEIRPASRSDSRFPPLDGLRAIAAAVVVLSHTAYLAELHAHGFERRELASAFGIWSFGSRGVELFFVLSGFLLFRPYARQLLGGPPGPSANTFYTRRARRVLPAYWVALTISVLFISPLIGTHVTAGDVVLHVFVVHNAVSGDLGSLSGVFWTMAVEVQFYVLLPIIAAGLIAVGRRSRRMAVGLLVAATLVVSPASIFASSTISSAYPGARSQLGLLIVLTYFAPFAAGMTAATVDVWARLASARQPERIIRVIAVGGLALLCVRIAANMSLSFLPGDQYLLYVELGLGFAGVLLGVLHIWLGASRVLSTRPLHYFALISYSVYLWHWPIYWYLIVPVARRLPIGMVPAEILGFPVLIALATLSYRVTERPFFHAAAARS